MAVRGLMCLHLPCLFWSPLAPTSPGPPPAWPCVRQEHLSPVFNIC